MIEIISPLPYSVMSLGLMAPSLSLWRTTAAMTPNRAPISSTLMPFSLQLGKSLVPVGGMHVRADRILGKADLRAAMLGTEDAADRLVAFDPLALYAEQLRKPASLPVTR